MKTEKGREPLLRRPMRSDEEKDARRHRQLPKDARKERRRRKRVSEPETPPLSKSVERLCFLSVAPREEAREMRRCRRREEVDVRTAPTKADGVEYRWRKMPVWKRLEARRCICVKILLRRNKDGENAEAKRMGEEKHFPREEKERERERATFVPHVSQCRRAVRPPQEIAGAS